MGDRISKKFMSQSNQILDDDPHLKEKLNKVMGKVADDIVKKKYVGPNGCPDKCQNECPDESDSRESDLSA